MLIGCFVNCGAIFKVILYLKGYTIVLVPLSPTQDICWGDIEEKIEWVILETTYVILLKFMFP